MRSSRISTILATTALAVAVFGSTPLGHAAARMIVPANSVGAGQLKQNAVTSKKVKDGTLLASDFKTGQIPAGPKGDKGEPGAKGDQGDPGVKGDKGDKGDTVGWGFAFGSILVPLCGIAALFAGASLAAKGKIGHGAGIIVVTFVLASISIWAWWALWIGMSPGS